MSKQLTKIRGEIILYGTAIALNRGSMLFIMPIITGSLSLLEYGQYTYVLVLAQLLAPILSLNISASIMREGADHLERAHYLNKVTSLGIVLITILLSGVLYLFKGFFSYQYVYFIILIAGTEALHNSLLGYLRASERHYSYLIFTVVKTLGLLTALMFMKDSSRFSLFEILAVQSVINVLIFVFYQVKVIIKDKARKFLIKSAIIFSLLLLPHTLAQWGMSAFNRFIVKHLLGDYQLGVFGVTYSVALIGMILNSGIAIVLPQHMIKNYDLWTQSKTTIKFYLYYSLVFLTIYGAILIGYKIDKSHFHLIGYYSPDFIKYMTLIFVGFYLLGFYYYYINILFYHKLSKVISLVTIITALVSIGVTFLMTKWWGLTGAAASVLVTYGLYLIFAFYFAYRAENKLVSSLKITCLIIAMFFTIMYLMNVLFTIYFI